MISIQTHIAKVLSSYIKSFWYLKVSNDLDKPYIEDVLPDGHPEIVFHLNSSSIRRPGDSEVWQSDPAIYFTGHNRKSYTQKLHPGSVIYAVRFHPHTQRVYYNLPASRLTDNTVPFRDVFSRDILPGCITVCPEQTFANLEKEFIKKTARLKPQETAFQYADAAVNRIIALKGNLKISSLEKVTGVSTRYLEKCFEKYVGVTPKEFCSLVKFKHFVTYKQNNPRKTLTECACETGFYDQSHLIYLSQRITGSSAKVHFGKPNFINSHFLEH